MGLGHITGLSNKNLLGTENIFQEINTYINTYSYDFCFFYSTLFLVERNHPTITWRWGSIEINNSHYASEKFERWGKNLNKPTKMWNPGIV